MIFDRGKCVFEIQVATIVNHKQIMGVRVIVSFLGPTTGTRILSNYHLSSRLLRFVPGYDEGEFGMG